MNTPKAPKVGRNDPCPCGSGLKYKKCCLEKDRTKKSGVKKEGTASKIKGKLTGGAKKLISRGKPEEEEE
jgi:hypothetical protein